MDDNESACLRITLPLASSSMRLHWILHLGLAFAIQVEKSGGRAKCFKLPDRIVVEMSGIEKAYIDTLCDSLGHSMQGGNLNLVVEERTAPEVDLETNDVCPGEFASRKLTKKFLLGLPNGAIIVGNTFLDGVPAFMVRLHGGQQRSSIWNLAVRREAAQRICHVYWDAEDVKEIHGVHPDDPVDDEDDDLDLAPFAR